MCIEQQGNPRPWRVSTVREFELGAFLLGLLSAAASRAIHPTPPSGRADVRSKCMMQAMHMPTLRGDRSCGGKTQDKGCA
jgi:hypothetical protein